MRIKTGGCDGERFGDQGRHLWVTKLNTSSKTRGAHYSKTRGTEFPTRRQLQEPDREMNLVGSKSKKKSTCLKCRWVRHQPVVQNKPDHWDSWGHGQEFLHLLLRSLRPEVPASGTRQYRLVFYATVVPCKTENIVITNRESIGSLCQSRDKWWLEVLTDQDLQYTPGSSIILKLFTPFPKICPNLFLVLPQIQPSGTPNYLPY